MRDFPTRGERACRKGTPWQRLGQALHGRFIPDRAKQKFLFPFPVHLRFDNTFGPPPAERALFLVDDDPNDRLLFAHELEQARIPNPYRYFKTGDEMINALIDVLRGGPPPLACFLDLNMPGMDGFDVLRWIRLQDALAEIAVIMMSSCDEPRMVSRAMSLGAQCFVKKFPSTAQLKEILDEAQRFSVVACGRSSFELPCNLLIPHATAA